MRRVCRSSALRRSSVTPPSEPRSRSTRTRCAARTMTQPTRSRLAGLSPPVTDVGNIRDTTGSVEHQESELSVCLDDSPGTDSKLARKTAEIKGIFDLALVPIPPVVPLLNGGCDRALSDLPRLKAHARLRPGDGEQADSPVGASFVVSPLAAGLLCWPKPTLFR